MDLTLYRISDNGDSTLGILYVDGIFQCYTLEDTQREDKIQGDTAIWKGEYEVGLRHVESPLTETYRQEYDYFKYHLELKGIEGFDNVYIHIGNYPKDTRGCILVGNGQQLAPTRMVTHSTGAFRKLYNMIYDAAKAEKAKIRIK